MARFVDITAVLALSLFSFSSCSTGVSDRRVELENADDSISFAVSMLIAEKMPVAMQELGIDDSTLPAFLRGVKDAFPVDGTPDAVAYSQGVLMAASAMDMLDRANKAIYPDDTIKEVDRRLFLEGLIATAYGTGKTMTTSEAKEYYNLRIFRSASEDFVNRNKKRPGVVVLPSGLQYKVESLGTGAVARPYDTVSCVYKGTFPNGAVFDTSRGKAIELEVSRQVKGLAEALATLPSGTKCKLYIPWYLAYGAKGTDKIPPYSALVYDIEIEGIVEK